MVSVLMLKSIGNIDYDYLKEIENNIKNNISISIQDITYFLECIVYITRIKIMDDDSYLDFKCDLAQSIICHYLDDLNVTYFPNVTYKAITNTVIGHSFVVATFKVSGKEINYLIDPTYIQFFKSENCTEKKFVVFNGIVIKTPDPGYFIKYEDRKFINDFNYNGFGILNENLARIYGNSFYNTRTMRMDISFDELKGSTYINSFLKGNEKLSTSREELISNGKYINLDIKKITK